MLATPLPNNPKAIPHRSRIASAKQLSRCLSIIPFDCQFKRERCLRNIRVIQVWRIEAGWGRESIHCQAVSDPSSIFHPNKRKIRRPSQIFSYLTQPKPKFTHQTRLDASTKSKQLYPLLLKPQPLSWVFSIGSKQSPKEVEYLKKSKQLYPLLLKPQPLSWVFYVGS